MQPLTPPPLSPLPPQNWRAKQGGSAPSKKKVPKAPKEAPDAASNGAAAPKAAAPKAAAKSKQPTAGEPQPDGSLLFTADALKAISYTDIKPKK